MPRLLPYVGKAAVLVSEAHNFSAGNLLPSNAEYHIHVVLKQDQSIIDIRELVSLLPPLNPIR